ncbi:MAG: tetratricopeptide repeat protein [Actinomycetales bacterium]
MSTLTVTAHRNDHGPFTAPGNILRALRVDLLRDHRDLLQAHDVEVLSAAPEYAADLANLRPTQTSSIDPRARTRYYPPAWITRICHGLVDLMLVLAERGVLRTIEFTHLANADPSDTEFVAVLARRSAGRILVREVAAQDPPPAPDLATYYVETDCVSDDPEVLSAYVELEEAVRQALHGKRMRQIREAIAGGCTSLRRWTLAMHAERSGDPQQAVSALTEAIEACVLEGFYDAVVELGSRLLPLLDPASQPDERWLVIAKVTLAQSALGRLEDAEAAYDEACAATTHPSTHLQSYYGRAMLLTRFAEPSERDHRRAEALVNTAITIASLLPDDARREFNTTFNENGLALVEMHLGNLHESLRLVETGIARLDQATEHDRDLQHRWVLEHNRAQLLTALARPHEALECYAELLQVDPHHSEYHLDHAGVLRAVGRLEEAESELGEAIRCSPPYPEAVYNRADLRASCGDLAGAVADLRRVLELDPAFPNACANLAGLLLEEGQARLAREVAANGLRADPADVALRTVLAQAEHELGDLDAAVSGYRAALEIDPHFVPALAGRAVAAFEVGTADSLHTAVECLERAVRLSDDPDLVENLALAVSRQEVLGKTASGD